MTEEEGTLYTIDDYYDDIKDHMFPDEKISYDENSTRKISDDEFISNLNTYFAEEYNEYDNDREDNNK